MATKKTEQVTEVVENAEVEAAPVEEAPKKAKTVKKAKKAKEVKVEKPAKPMPTEAKATSMNVRLTPRKARIVLDLVRGKDVKEAPGS
jgi:hypothetical protein